MSDSLFYRRRLPHWHAENAVYFVTWRIAEGQPELDSIERDQVASALKWFDQNRYNLIAFVVMNDHVHVLLSCLNDNSLEQIVHSWKSFTANQLQRTNRRKGRLWQDEYFDRIIRDEREFKDKLTYVMNNPTKRWPDLNNYPWVWLSEVSD